MEKISAWDVNLHCFGKEELKEETLMLALRTAEEKVTKSQMVSDWKVTEGLYLQFLRMILCAASRRLPNTRDPEKSCVTRSQGPFRLTGGREELGQEATSLIQS